MTQCLFLCQAQSQVDIGGGKSLFYSDTGKSMVILLREVEGIIN